MKDPGEAIEIQLPRQAYELNRMGEELCDRKVQNRQLNCKLCFFYYKLLVYSFLVLVS